MYILALLFRFDLQRYEELALLEEKREKVNRTYRRLLAKITRNPTEFRMKTEKFISDMENVKRRETTSSVVLEYERESGIQSLSKLA
ncbi:hypothetical protein lerEdw1_008263 [Lerista edwardsae]|nr:hypothetical protein lerEdw1_008263 [Lerista edwardsae]